jgi:hypothetical protein
MIYLIDPHTPGIDVCIIFKCKAVVHPCYGVDPT